MEVCGSGYVISVLDRWILWLIFFGWEIGSWMFLGRIMKMQSFRVSPWCLYTQLLALLYPSWLTDWSHSQIITHNIRFDEWSFEPSCQERCYVWYLCNVAYPCKVYSSSVVWFMYHTSSEAFLHWLSRYLELRRIFCPIYMERRGVRLDTRIIWLPMPRVILEIGWFCV